MRNWSKWGAEFWKSVIRHVGTAGLTALAVSYHDGNMNWRTLGIGLLCGGVMPSAFTFLQANPIPDEIEEVTTLTTKTTLTKTTTQLPDETPTQT